MLKKSIFGLLAFALVFALAACGSGNNDSSESAPGTEPAPSQSQAAESPSGSSEAAAGDIEPEPGAKLLVWDGKDGLPFLQEIAKDFTAEYGIPVEVQEQGGPEQLEKMKTDGPAGSAADILTQPHNDLGNAVKSGFVLPNDFYEEQTRAEFIQPAVDAVTNNGVLYGYPRNMETYALFVNKDLVKDAPLETWDDVIAFAKSFNDVKNNKYGFMTKLDTLYYTYPFFSGYGGYVFGNNGTNPEDIGLNNEGSVEGMKFFSTLKEILPMAPADASDDIKTSLFQDGKLAINLDGVWNIGNFSKLGFDVTMVPLPKFPNGQTPISFAGVKAYYVSAYSKYPNAAKLFARYATSKEALLKNFEIISFIPARKGMEEEPAIKNNEMVVGALKQLENSQPMPSIIEMNSVWTPIQQALELIWNGGDVKATLDKAVEDIRIGISTQND